MRRKILFAATTLVVGGAERVFAELVLRLDRSRFDVRAATLRDPGRLGEEIAAAGVPVRSGWTGASRLDLGLIPRLRRWIRSEGFEAIYLLDHPHAIFHTLLASIGTSARVRVMPVHTTGRWGGLPSVPRSTRRMLRWIDAVIAIADAQREYLIREEGIPPEKLVVIKNGIALEALDRGERLRRRAALREELGLGADAKLIAILAVLRPEKNHELLFSALARLRGSLPDLTLLVVGDGPRRAFLEDEARRLGIEGCVRFLGHRSDGRGLWPAADLAVLVSHPRVETLPLSLLEAMDAALPIVATDVGALREIVEPGGNGRLVPPEDEAALAEAIREILSDPSVAAAYGERSSEIVRAAFGVERMVHETEALLLDLLDSRK